MKQHDGGGDLRDIPLSDEARRMAAIRRYDILDTPADGSFDRITRLAARIFDVPISVVSIVDVDRIWFKSHHGLDVVEVGRDPGLCASAILSNEPWIVSDARADPRSLANPLVAGELGLGFYAGAPLITPEGFRLGTICVMDHSPRVVTDSEAETLTDLAAIVVDELELRLSARRTLEVSAELRLKAEREGQVAERAARTDPLTRLGNRRALDADFAARVAHARPDGTDVAVVMLDIDGLKSINDRQGHAEGDALLLSFAAALTGAFRSDDLLYRIGGDEFVLVIVLKHRHDVEMIKQRIAAALSRTRTDGHPTMDVSIGIAMLSEVGWRETEALALADRRMYDHKARVYESLLEASSEG